jgi:hypothetical protein
MKLIEKYLLKGFTQEEAEQKVKDSNAARSAGLKRSWDKNKDAILEKRAINLVPKLRGKKRSKKSRLKMSVAQIKYKEENPEEYYKRYETFKETMNNKPQEEKDKENKKRGESIKAAWDNPENKLIYEERNKKISIANFGKERSEESKNKQAITNTGKVQSEETKLKRAQTRYEKMLRGEYLGVRCKMYNINGIHCQGRSEKAYIEKLIKENKELPTNTKHISTPIGIYHPDFEYPEKYIEVKSEFTFKIFNGEIENIDNKISLNQKEKAIWVAKNIKPIEIIVINDKGKVSKILNL